MSTIGTAIATFTAGKAALLQCFCSYERLILNARIGGVERRRNANTFWTVGSKPNGAPLNKYRISSGAEHFCL